MFKKLCVAAVAAMATLIPVGAEVQPGTSSLIETIDAIGILVTINHEECAAGIYNGQYRWLGFQRELRLCPGRTVDARDHETVRHEVIHAIQHCINVARGTTTDTPASASAARLTASAWASTSPHRVLKISCSSPVAFSPAREI